MMTQKEKAIVIVMLMELDQLSVDNAFLLCKAANVDQQSVIEATADLKEFGDSFKDFGEAIANANQ
jgi:hypothetical protein